jgi:hypothetical protein
VSLQVLLRYSRTCRKACAFGHSFNRYSGDILKDKRPFKLASTVVPVDLCTSKKEQTDGKCGLVARNYLAYKASATDNSSS